MQWTLSLLDAVLDRLIGLVFLGLLQRRLDLLSGAVHQKLAGRNRDPRRTDTVDCLNCDPQMLRPSILVGAGPSWHRTVLQPGAVEYKSATSHFRLDPAGPNPTPQLSM